MLQRVRRGSAKKESLHFVCAHRSNHVELSFSFNPFHNHLHAHFLRQPDERTDHSLRLTPAYVLQEDAVDLKGVERQSLDMAECGVSRSEVIDRNRDSEALKPLNCRDSLLHSNEYYRFSQFKLQEYRWQAGLLQNRFNFVRERIPTKLHVRDIYGNFNGTYAVERITVIRGI